MKLLFLLCLALFSMVSVADYRGCSIYGLQDSSILIAHASGGVGGEIYLNSDFNFILEN
mgnify:CR=1 FL=1